jgi:integrase
VLVARSTEKKEVDTPAVAEPIEHNEARILEDTKAQRAALPTRSGRSTNFSTTGAKCWCPPASDAVQEIDTAIGRAATRADIAEAKINALEGDLVSVRAAKRDAYLAANLARAQQLAEEARQLIVGDYAKAASSIAETLGLRPKASVAKASLTTISARIRTRVRTNGTAGNGSSHSPGTARRSATRWSMRSTPRRCFRCSSRCGPAPRRPPRGYVGGSRGCSTQRGREASSDADRANPARWRGHLDLLLPNPDKIGERGHRAAMPYSELPGFMDKLSANPRTVARALEFLILTAARSVEVIGTTWDEVDLAAKRWTVPASRMKMGVEYEVPLSEATVDLLRGQRATRRAASATGRREGGASLTRWSLAKRSRNSNSTRPFRPVSGRFRSEISADF